MRVTKEEYNKQICDSLDIMYKWAKRGSIRGQIKDKYDSTRWYASFGGFEYPWSLHDFFYPGHYYYRWPSWTRKLNQLSALFFKYTGLGALIIKWQMYCYSKAYEEILQIAPDVDHCIDHEILLNKSLLKLYDEYQKTL